MIGCRHQCCPRFRHTDFHWHKPQVTLFGAFTRLGADERPFLPEQAMTIQEALYAHTMGSARAAFEEEVKGSLEPGKYADLVV